MFLIKSMCELQKNGTFDIHTNIYIYMNIYEIMCFKYIYMHIPLFFYFFNTQSCENYILCKCFKGADEQGMSASKCHRTGSAMCV